MSEAGEAGEGEAKYEPAHLNDAISRQIAEDLVESCNATCKSPTPTINAILTDDTLNRILGKLGNGKYVKFKSMPMRLAFAMIPNSSIIAGLRTRLDKHPYLSEFIDDICRNQCHVETLQGVTKFMIQTFGSMADVDKYFVMQKPPHGGTKRFVRRSRGRGRGTAKHFGRRRTTRRLHT
jgi:hypothetical protein